MISEGGDIYEGIEQMTIGFHLSPIAWNDCLDVWYDWSGVIDQGKNIAWLGNWWDSLWFYGGNIIFNFIDYWYEGETMV